MFHFELKLFSKNKAAGSGEAKTIKDYLGLIIIVAVVCIFILSYFFLIKPVFTKQEKRREWRRKGTGEGGQSSSTRHSKPS